MSNELKAAEEQAALEFKAGFEGDKAIETNEPSIASTQDEPVEPVVAAPEYVQLTKEQFDNMQSRLGEIDNLKTGLGKASGSIGTLNQVIEQLKSSTKAGSPVELTDDVVDGLKSEFGDELGGAVLAALKKAAPALRGTGQAIDPLKIRQDAKAEAEATYTAKRTAELQQELTEEHPDWATVRNTKEFQEWRAKLNKPEQDRLNTTNSVTYLSKKLTEFKDSLKKQASQPKPNQRQAIVNAAVQPRGDGGSLPTKTANDDFHAGFYKKK